jgi:hypothetical protein
VSLSWPGLGGAALVGCVRLRLLERYDNDRLEDDGALLDLDFEERFLAQAQGSPDVRRHGDPSRRVHGNDASHVSAVYPTARRTVKTQRSRFDTLTYGPPYGYASCTMKRLGVLTTKRERGAAIPTAGACLGLYSPQGHSPAFGMNPIDRHRARSLLCGSNWNSHD